MRSYWAHGLLVVGMFGFHVGVHYFLLVFIGFLLGYRWVLVGLFVVPIGTLMDAFWCFYDCCLVLMGLALDYYCVIVACFAFL